MDALLWNVNRKDPGPILDSLIAQLSADIVVIPECPRSAKAPAGYVRLTTPYSALTIFSKRKSSRLIAEDPSERFVAVSHTPSSVTIIGCHLLSKLHGSDEDSFTAAGRLRHFIESIETQVGHDRTVVLGDMNMDPFENGMVHCDGLHAVMTRHIATRGTRTVQRAERKFFYNPMWSHYGDSRETAPATYFYASSKSRAYFWHMYDQILIRPILIPTLVTVSILESAGQTVLVDAEHKPLTAISDHLPVSVTLDSLRLAAT